MEVEEIGASISCDFAKTSQRWNEQTNVLIRLLNINWTKATSVQTWAWGMAMCHFNPFGQLGSCGSIPGRSWKTHLYKDCTLWKRLNYQSATGASCLIYLAHHADQDNIGSGSTWGLTCFSQVTRKKQRHYDHLIWYSDQLKTNVT